LTSGDKIYYDLPFGLHKFASWTSHSASWTEKTGWTAWLEYALSLSPSEPFGP